MSDDLTFKRDVVADCWDCGGFGCKPPSDTCPTCDGKGLLRYGVLEPALRARAAVAAKVDHD